MSTKRKAEAPPADLAAAITAAKEAAALRTRALPDAPPVIENLYGDQAGFRELLVTRAVQRPESLLQSLPASGAAQRLLLEPGPPAGVTAAAAEPPQPQAQAQAAAAAAAEAQQQARAQAAQAAPPPPAPPPVLEAWGPWRRLADPSSGGSYFWHAPSGATSWAPPPGWGAVAPPAAPPAAAAAAAADAQQQPHPAAAAGYFYKDVAGSAQGPFTRAQLEAWRAVLPLELRVWRATAASAPPPGRPPPPDSQTQPLGEVLGDDSLLGLLRSGQLPLLAPHSATAAAVEAVLAAAEAAAAEAEAVAAAAWGGGGGGGGGEGAGGEGPEEGGGMSFADLAAASLAGLPREARAAALAPQQQRPAARGGGGGGGGYLSAPVLNTRTGRLTSTGQGLEAREEAAAAARGAHPGYFSSRLDAYCDTTKLETWLKDVAANRGEQAKNNQKMWRVLAERKAAVKKEMRARELAKEL